MDEPLDGRFRAFGERPGLTLSDIGAQGWSVPGRDLPFPLLVLRASALEHNLRLMHGWCAERGLSLAPHGKTHMAPQLARRQLDAGAWGMTAATVHQAAVMHAAGARRVLIANEVVGRAEASALARLLGSDPDLELLCLVDSEAGVERLGAGLCGVQRPLGVLVELGAARARTGCRSDEEALAVAAAVGRAPALRLAGVEGYEGSVGHDRERPTLAAIDAFLDRLPALAARLDALGAFAGAGEIVLSAGGSAYFDRVAERVPRAADLSRPVRVVLRSGCYLTHDHGHYAELSPLPALQPAFRLWTEVISRPEPGLAIAGFGKRDAPFDLGPPLPELVVRRSGERVPAEGLEVTRMDDQHAYLGMRGRELEVGDLVVCGISHPCTAFDKWSLLPVVDDEDVVVDAIRTRF